MEFKNKARILVNSKTSIFRELREDALEIFAAALDAVDPKKAIGSHIRMDRGAVRLGDLKLDLDAFSHIFVVGGGKAGGAMSEAVESVLGDRISGGVVNVLAGTEDLYNLKHISLNPASHPIPDDSGVRGVERMLSIVNDARPNDLLIVLISGGGSALMTHPAEGVRLQDLQKVTDLLLRSGATINELNAVRKHLSDFKGGQLAKRAYPSRVLSLILSDVVGDPLDTIASGPTAPDETTFRDAVNILKSRRVWADTPEAVRHRLEKGVRGEIDETPKAGDEVFKNVTNVIVGSNLVAAKAAQRKALSKGYHTMILSTRVEGEARHIGTAMAGIAREIVATDNPLEKPAAIIVGGETTVTVTGSGVGGRNQEIALSASLRIPGSGVLIASLATDGIDGPTNAAGALVDGSTVDRSHEMELDPKSFLANNDSHSYFSRLGDLLITGPTGTNVNDLTLILVSK
jgi:glycerate 2-kinase